MWRALMAFAGDPDVASEARAEAFAQALCKNVLDGERIEKARELAAYAEAAMADLAQLDDATLLRGAWRFPVLEAARAQ